MTATQISGIKIDFDIKNSFNSIFILSLILQSWILSPERKFSRFLKKKTGVKKMMENDGK